VLVDSERLAVRIDVRVLAELGWVLSEREVIERFVGRSHEFMVALPTCVASSGSHDKMRYTLGLTGLYDRFAGRIFSASEVARGKPAPDLFLHAAKRMGIDPALCAVVEDSGHGVEAARAAGMLALGFAGGVTAAERLRGPNTLVFSDMRELPQILRGAALRDGEERVAD
jgi:beta-phosphoglucomutase-like phosphatase (HAD superfamily)